MVSGLSADLMFCRIPSLFQPWLMADLTLLTSLAMLADNMATPAAM
jgi:hypothetical protein